ncbi:protein zer-1 homolog [Belonocnema kinseyi]|uniref:protein zer-1 homolog n=1 Tax=Belonocnema kinseyi TaxID=2817044 RepID=UPI00143DDBAD|nr:protein zer-1 homolog [Belonocnema kinseyi]
MSHLDILFDSKQYAGLETLTNLCYKVICENLDIISTKGKRGHRTLRKGLAFPSEICDKIIEYAQHSEAIEENDCFFSIFKNVLVTKLKRVKINNCSLTDSSVLTIASHKVTELEFNNCSNLTELSIEHVNANAENLQSLAFRGCFNQLKPNTDTLDVNYCERGYVFSTPNLRRLTVGNITIRGSEYTILLEGLCNLSHLDLSNNQNIGNFYFYSLVPNLVSLTLYDVKLNADAQNFVENVSHLKSLRHLDISQTNYKNGQYEMPDMILAGLVLGLPELVSLDIGGTNLAGRGVIERPLDKRNIYFGQLSDIPGLASRVQNPLQFLGLYGTSYGACRRHDIPAKIIAGDANEEQILVAARVSMNHKHEMLQKVLNDLYHIFRFENCKRMDQALCTVLEAMEKHPSEKQIQIAGSATLFYIVKSKEKVDASMKRRIIGTLLAGMSAHKDEETMMRNGCLALCQFRIPQDVMWNYEALVKVLLHSAKHSEPESFVQRIGIYLLNSLACQVEGKEKRLLGKLGCVETMLQLVEYRVVSGIFDDVLEVAWSTMWNMTDETDINCQRFLNKQGMDLFLKCVRQYPNKEELLRNMMGLLGNVAEWASLRSDLMQEQYVSIFACLLRSDSDGIEVSYNAAGILAHMASDGVEAWTVEKPSRTEVLDLMVEAIDRWNINSERNINYRSFLPLLRLLDVFHTPQCQHWAVWALANLTKVYPNKYCKLVVAEGGIEQLKNLLASDLPYECIKHLARQVIANCIKDSDNSQIIDFSSWDHEFALDG